VSKPKSWIFPGFHETAVLLPESFVPASSRLAPSAPLPRSLLQINKNYIIDRYFVKYLFIFDKKKLKILTF
jgi:hypothetical protein